MTRTLAAGELARALISAVPHGQPPKWAPALEQLLHRSGCRESLTPTLVARVIDPFLLHHHSLASGFFHWASQQPNFSHNSDTYQSILKSLSTARQFNALDKVMKQIKALNLKIHPSVYGTLISSLVAGRKTGAALSIFNSSVSSGIGSRPCNSLLAALSSEGNFKDAPKVFDEMLQRGVPLTTLGFGVFIWRLCRNGAEAGQILKLLDDVRNGDFSGINGSIIAALIVHGLCSESRTAEAMLLLDELRSRECKPDFIAYRIVAEAFREMGCAYEVLNALKKKRKLGVAPRVNDYKNFIFGLISEKLLLEAKELAEVIVSGNFPLDDDVLNALVASVSTVDPSSAVAFLEYMLQRRTLPTLLTLTNLNSNLCKHGRVNELVEVFKVLSANEYFTDLPTYSLKVEFLCKAGRLREAYESFQEMRKKGIFPDVCCYNTLLDACCREDMIRPAKRLWDEMFKSGCQGNVLSYSILITKFVEIREAEEAHRLFCHMLDKDMLPDETIVTPLIAGLCKAKQIDTAFTVFRKCSEKDTELGNAIFNTLVLNLCGQGLFLQACKLLRSRSCESGNLECHVTYLKLLADAEEVSLATDHLRWMGDASPVMLDNLYYFNTVLSVFIKGCGSCEVLQRTLLKRRSMKSVSKVEAVICCSKPKPELKLKPN